MFQNSILLKVYIPIILGIVYTQDYSVSGIIVDSETNEPINNVNVFIENTNYLTTSNNEGYFLLSLLSKELNDIEINFSMIGYQDQLILIDISDKDSYLNKVLLIPKALELEPIHIHSHIHESKQISNIILSGQKLNDNLDGTLAATLSNQSNVGVNAFGIIASKPILRGYSGDRFLITKDGNKMGDLSQTSIDHVNTLDMTEVNKIEIIRGPKSLIYGSNTIGGVVNTEISGSPKAKASNIFTKILMGSQSYNKGFYGNMMFYIPFQDNQLNISINNRNTENQITPIGIIENTSSHTSNFKLGFTRYKKNSYINFIFEKYNMAYGIPASIEGHINGVDIDLFKNTFQLNYHQDVSFYNFNQLDIKYYFIDYEHQEFENNLDYYSVALSNKMHSFNIKVESSDLIVGSEINYKQFLPGGFYWTPETNQLDFSIYGFYEKEFNDFDFSGSIRTGYSFINPTISNLSFSNLNEEDIKNRKFKYFSTSIGIQKEINNFKFDSWIMSTMRAPRIEELYSDGPHLGSYAYEIGEPNLQLEKIYGIESSVSYNTNPINIDLTTFYNYSPYYFQMVKMGECEYEYVPGESHPCSGEDYIEWGSGSSGWLYKYKTEGIRSIIKGLEFNLSYNYQDFNFEYNYAQVRGYDLLNDLPLSYMNPDKHIFFLGLQKKNTSYKFRFSKINAQNRLGEFETFTPSAYLVDFIIGYEYNSQNLTIQFNNILNRKHYNHLSKIKSIMPEAGRNIVIYYKILL